MAAENPNFGIPKIQWPTEVTPDNMTKVREHLKNSDPMEVAVAKTLFSETKQLYIPLFRSLNPASPDYSSINMRLADFFNAYSLLAAKVLLLHSRKKEGRYSPEEGSQKFLSGTLGNIELLRALGYFTQKQFEAEEMRIVGKDVELWFHRLRFAKALETESLIEGAELLVSYELEELKTSRKTEEVKTLEHGRRRFYQLYTAAQQLPSSP